MKEDYYDSAVSFGSLYKGMKKSCNNVRWKDSVAGYEFNGLKNTYVLQQSLKQGTYALSPYQRFVIFDPKKRDIVATRLKDRQFQRSMCDSGLYEDIVEHLIRDNCACIAGRGIDDALNRMKVHLQRYYRKHGSNGWVLKCDIHHYFESISHDVAKNAVFKCVSDKQIAEKVCDVIDSFETGLGLGSQISQLVALAVLNDMDHMIKERLHIKGYVRYMDDFILIHESKEHLQFCLREIERHLASLGLKLNHKTCIFPLKHGFRFLKWRFVLTDTGKVLMLIDKKKISRQTKRVKKILAKERDGTMPHGTASGSMAGWVANASKGNSYNAVRQMQSTFNRLEEEYV